MEVEHRVKNCESFLSGQLCEPDCSTLEQLIEEHTHPQVGQNSGEAMPALAAKE